MTTFDKWDREFRRRNMAAFNHSPSALLWLKAKAICRKPLLIRFANQNNIKFQSTRITDQFRELFSYLKQSEKLASALDQFLRQQNNEWYALQSIDEQQLKADLYQVTEYTWGGDRNNSLDKFLVSNYVKSISNYEQLLSKQSEIAHNAWMYVRTSWYNNWTSYLIESIFKRHQRVISAVGEIKSVDFFIDNYPIDLKVTYLPNEYLTKLLSERLGCSLQQWLKRQAAALNVPIFNNSRTAITETIEKLTNAGHSDVIKELASAQNEIIRHIQDNPEPLMKWLYENQGEMRFGAENRIYLILVDAAQPEQSWKLKRDFDLIKTKVDSYLDNFNKSSIKTISFTFKGDNYEAMADIIFVIKHPIF